MQRSKSGNGGFVTIGEVLPNSANSNSERAYDYQDKDLAWSQYYYRIVQVNLDGRESYSDVVALQIAQDGFSVYPNPTDRELRISSPIFQTLDEVRINVYDQTGKLVFGSQYKLQSIEEISIPVTQLHTGIYSIEILDEGVSLYTQRFIRK